MTTKDAYEAWMRSEKDHYPTNLELWQAACEWQKHKDAEIVLKVASTFKAPDAYFVFADAIRDQP